MTEYEFVVDWFAQLGVTDPSPLDDWLQSFTAIELPKGEALVRTGDFTTRIYLVRSGLLRLYYLSPEGKERNKAFYGSGQLIGAVSASITHSAASFDIEALEPTIVLEADSTTLYKNAWRHPEFARAQIRLLSDGFVRNETREALLLTSNAEQRYRWLCEHEPHLLDRVSQFHLASYLGIDAVSLSRIKRTVGSLVED